jgi:hypothetical protein
MISGIITNKNDDSPIIDAQVRISGDKEFLERTDIFGYYQIENIDAGMYLEITAAKDGMIFSPEILRIASLNSNRTINFTAVYEDPEDNLKPQEPKYPSASRKTSTVIVSPSGRSSNPEDVHVISKPANGVSQPQPEYVTATDSFFDSSQRAKVSSREKDSLPAKTTFDLSGKVIYYASGLVGVKVIVNDNKKLMTTTDINGYYSIKGLKSNQNYTVKFIRDGFTFNPSEYKIVDGNKDFVINTEATTGKQNISGRIAEGKNGIENVLIKIISGVDEFTAYTDNDGKFSVKGLAYGSNYFITASKEGVLVIPPKVTVNKLVSDRVINFKATVQKFSIIGTVRDYDGKAVKNAKVEAKTVFDTFKTVTNSKGRYIIEELPMALTYTLTANKEGYSPSEMIVIESLDKNKEINFQIKKESSPSVKKRNSADTSETKKPSESKQNKRSVQKERGSSAQEESKRESVKNSLKNNAEKPQSEDRDVNKKKEKSLKAERKKLEKERKKETEKQERLQYQEQIKKEKEKASKIKGGSSDKDSKPGKEKPKKVSSAKEKMVKVRGKIECKAGRLKGIELSMSHGFSAKTDEKGRYEFIVPADKRYTLTANSPDFYFEPQKVVYDGLKSNVVQDFVPYITIEGEVFAEGKGIPDVQINMNGAQVTSTNQFGRYKIEKIEYGSPVSIIASKNGLNFYPGSLQIAAVVKNLENANFTVSYSVAGKISTQIGNMVLGNVVIEVSGSTKTSVSTDFSGNFMLLGLAQGGYFEITPKAGGYSFTPPSRNYFNMRESFVGQNFSAVKETYVVKGNVNVGGKPIRNAAVSISKRPLKYYTDDEGDFYIANLDYGGPYVLNALSADLEFEPITIELLEKDTTVEFSTDISLGGIVVSGNNPLKGIIVDVNGKKHKTDEEGRYLITGLKYNGDYLLSLSAPGIIFNPSQKEYTGVKKSILNETFNASAIINGRVTYNEKPFAGASIKISDDPKEYKSDSNGYFLIKDLKLGEDYVLEISTLGYKFDPPKREYKNLSVSKMTENFKAFVSGLFIRGIVTDSDGNPLKQTAVMIEGASKAQTFTNELGQFIFDGLSANKRYELTVLSKSHKFETPSGIIDDMNTNMEIELEPGTAAFGVSAGTLDSKVGAKKVFFKINGKVTVNGKPLANVSIKSKTENLKTNVSGEYTVSVKSGDSVEIKPFLDGYAFSPEQYSLKDIKASASNMNFSARINSHNLSGRIINKKLKGIKGVSVKEENSYDDFMTESKGAYKITGLTHRKDSIIIPDSDEYDFYPQKIRVFLENNSVANDIYAYPKNIKKSEAFIYGGINSAVNIKENNVSVVMVCAEGGSVLVKISDSSGSVIKELKSNAVKGKAFSVDWDGRKSTGEDVPAGNYSVELDGAGFKGEVLKFRVFK